jgi:seryl-tRNA synthetase
VLDIRQIRENPELVQTKLDLRSAGVYDIQPILALDKQQRELESTRSQLQERSNEIGKLVGQKMAAKVAPTDPEIIALKAEGNTVKAQLGELEPAERELKAQIIALILQLPNLPSDTIPVGKGEEENVELRKWGDEYIPTNPEILPHWEIGEKLGILNFESSAKLAQSRFVTLIGAGAALERALISFMQDTRKLAHQFWSIPLR